MAITFSDDWALVTFDSGWEFLRLVLISFVVGVCSGALFTVYDPVLAHRLFLRAVAAVVVAVRLIKALVLGPLALGVAA